MLTTIAARRLTDQLLTAPGQQITDIIEAFGAIQSQNFRRQEVEVIVRRASAAKRALYGRRRTSSARS